MGLDFPITLGSVALSDANTTIPGAPVSDSEKTLCLIISHNTPLINYNLPGHRTPTNSNTSYPEKYSDRVLPPYPTGGGERGSAPSYPLPTGGSLPYPPEKQTGQN